MIISDGKIIKCYNGTADTIPANNIVIVKGKRINIASNDDINSTQYPLGYTLASINSGNYGEIVLEGTIQNINTTIYGSEGTILYLSTGGAITVTKPTTAIIIGTIIHSDYVTGSIYFKIISAASSSSGTITSIATTSPITGGPITNTGTIGITQANSTTNGYLSSTDWNTFNDKFDIPAGTTSEYVRGDGSVATFPTTGGGIPHGTASGTDTYTTTITGVTAYNDADAYLIRFTTGNTSSCTLQINTLAAVPLYKNNDGQLIGGDIINGAEMLCVYNSSTSRFQVIGTAPNTLLSYVTNAESTTITKGQAVYAFGGQGDRLKVKLAYNTSDATSAQTIGVVLSTSIGANQKGLIIMQGQIDNLNLFPTSTWADGDAVYLGATAGSLTKTKPHAPNHLVYLGFVTTASNGSAGRMYVRVQNGYEMDELHNVAAHNPSGGETLIYNKNNNLWEAKTVIVPAGMNWMGAFPG
jgi:hypothetical protein